MFTPGASSSATAAVVDEGVQLSGAAAWQADGVDGAGVKIGIVDGGFRGYHDRQASGDLPANLITQDYCAPGDFDGPQASEHGTAVAEIVHKMAPAAALYLLCSDTLVTDGLGVQWLKNQGVQIINQSGGYFNTGRGDGSGGPGTPDAIVADARAAGILWVNSAGNQAQEHWSGTFVDTNGDDIMDYTPNDEGNTFFMPAGASICIFLKWDDWPASAQDYDLLLVRSNPVTLVASSVNDQTGLQPPTESLCYLNNTGFSQDFFITIGRFKATTAPRFDLFVDAPAQLQYVTTATSLVEPATSPAAMAVGANCWQSVSIEPFSSRGPTIDGRTKPDITGPDQVSSATYGAFTTCNNLDGFAGTSASSPHVAGAAALVKEAYPSFSPAQLQSFLESHALDRGSTGKDSDYGAGELALGPPPAADVSVTQTASPNPVIVRRNLTLAISVANAGPAPARNVALTDTLPAGASFVSATTSQGSCTGTGPVSCNLGLMESGSSVTVTLAVAPGNEGSSANAATVASDTHDASAGNNTSTASANVVPVTLTGGPVRKSPAVPKAGGSFSASMQITSNTGPVQTATVDCHATASGKVLRNPFHGLRDGRATCTWAVPRGSGGKQLRGTLEVTHEDAHLRQAVTARIKK